MERRDLKCFACGTLRGHATGCIEPVYEQNILAWLVPLSVSGCTMDDIRAQFPSPNLHSRVRRMLARGMLLAMEGRNTKRRRIYAP